MARPPITKSRPWTPQAGRFAGQTFRTERAYRDALARAHGFANWGEQQKAPKRVAPKHVKELRKDEREGRTKAFRVLSRVRRGESRTAAERAEHTTHNTVDRWVGADLTRGPSGRVVATPSDRHSRGMDVLTIDGLQNLDVRSSRQRTLVSRHWNAIRLYRDYGELQPLRDLVGSSVAGHLLECDYDAIDEWARLGELEIEDIYAETA
jgi:hypothetical protein